MKLSSCVSTFFTDYLSGIKGVSPATIKSYRDVFALFLPFASEELSIKIESLKLKHINPSLVLDFLNYLESDRKNCTKTRNQRLAALKSFARMVRFLYPDYCDVADRILHIPKKRFQKKLIGFMYQDEILKILNSVDLNKKEGLRNYTMLHLLFDSGARATEVATLDLDYFDHQTKSLVILGKGNRYRKIGLWSKTTELIELYISKYRIKPDPRYRNRLFINQRGIGFTRYGINRMCRKYLEKTLDSKRLKFISPVHSFRHSCAVNMLSSGKSLAEIRNHLGHDNIQSTMVYLHMDLSRKREVMKIFMKYTHSVIGDDEKIDELLNIESEKDIKSWLDDL